MVAKTAAISRSNDSSTPPRLAADRIRASAGKLFYRAGIRAVGVEAIVAEAGVTKPSLYRAFASKDELAATYLRDYEAAFWLRFDADLAQYSNDPKTQILKYFERLAMRATQSVDYRGCGLSNAALEYPERDHPARQVAVEHKQRLHARLMSMAQAMGARHPQSLADGLMLLMEGVFVSGQLFAGQDGPARSLVSVARQLIDANLK